MRLNSLVALCLVVIDVCAGAPHIKALLDMKDALKSHLFGRAQTCRTCGTSIIFPSGTQAVGAGTITGSNSHVVYVHNGAPTDVRAGMGFGDHNEYHGIGFGNGAGQFAGPGRDHGHHQHDSRYGAGLGHHHNRHGAAHNMANAANVANANRYSGDHGGLNGANSQSIVNSQAISSDHTNTLAKAHAQGGAQGGVNHEFDGASSNVDAHAQSDNTFGIFNQEVGQGGQVGEHMANAQSQSLANSQMSSLDSVAGNSNNGFGVSSLNEEVPLAEDFAEDFGSHLANTNANAEAQSLGNGYGAQRPFFGMGGLGVGNVAASSSSSSASSASSSSSSSSSSSASSSSSFGGHMAGAWHRGNPQFG